MSSSYYDNLLFHRFTWLPEPPCRRSAPLRISQANNVRKTVEDASFEAAAEHTQPLARGFAQFGHAACN